MLFCVAVKAQQISNNSVGIVTGMTVNNVNHMLVSISYTRVLMTTITWTTSAGMIGFK